MSRIHKDRFARSTYYRSEMTHLVPVIGQSHSRWVSVHEKDGSFFVIVTTFTEADDTTPETVRILAECATEESARAFLAQYQIGTED